MEVCIGKYANGDYVLYAISEKAKYPPSQTVERLGYPYIFPAIKMLITAILTKAGTQLNFITLIPSSLWGPQSNGHAWILPIASMSS